MLKDLGLPVKEIEALFQYLFGLIDSRTYKERVTNGYHLKQDVIDKSGYILKNCKLYAYAYLKAKASGTKLPKSTRYRVSKQDARILRNIDLSGVNTEYRAFSLNQYDSVVTSFITSPELNLFLNKLISKKLRFLIKSYGDSREDLKGYLKEVAIYHIYRTYPYYETYLHLCNIGKGIISKSSIDLIRSRTAQKNQRLQKTSCGNFEAVLIPIDAIHTDMNPEVGRPVVPSARELKVKGKAKKFIRILSGEYDEGFSDYLGENNSDAAINMRFASYKSQLQKYLQVTPKQVNRLFERLREM